MALVLDSGRERDAGLDQLLSGYKPLPGVFDEMMDRDGWLRAHWQPILSMLAGLGAEEINRRFAAADRHLRDSGVFYRVYEDPAGAERSWPLSHVPLVIDAAEWEQLKAGLVQRAALLEEVLADVYGPADLVRDGRLPAALIAGNSGISAPAGRRRAAGRRAPAVLRRRSRAFRRRRMVGAGRPHAGALGRRLRAGEPARARARHAGHLSRAAGEPARAVLPGVPGRAFGAQPPGRFARMPADAGPDERDLFRARLSRPLSRLPAGRGRGPDRPRRRRVHPHRVRPQARRGAAAPPRRRLRRSARTQCPLASRRARAGAGGARRQGRDRQFARRRPGREPARCSPSCRRSRPPCSAAISRSPTSRPGGSDIPISATR